jgi:putative ATPase
MTNNLFDEEQPLPHGNSPDGPEPAPLADRMRPTTLAEVVGQGELVGPGGPLRLLLEADRLPSLLLWGPPGCGKTTLARLVARHTDARFLEHSAVAVGTKELKAVMGDAERLKRATGQRTILFLDEIHRFNKAQQDALLPWVERGDVTLIGATTENPSFEINSALISRTRLFVLAPLLPADIRKLLQHALSDARGLDGRVHLAVEALDLMANMCEGDARVALGLLESVALTAAAAGTGDRPETALDVEQVVSYIQTRAARYDKSGDEHFNLISALHKSMRNSDVNAAVYWVTRMLAGGEDPLYIARRLVRFASEDIGLADPEALRQALAARDAVHFIGLPEGTLALTQAVAYMSLAPKSNALYKGHQKAQREVARGQNPPVPLHLRNAPTQLMKALGHGEGYAYAHDQADGLAAMNCLPDALQGACYYEPGRRGFEAELGARMEQIRRWHERRQQNRPVEEESTE